jgi:hypothetical protein
MNKLVFNSLAIFVGIFILCCANVKAATFKCIPAIFNSGTSSGPITWNDTFPLVFTLPHGLAALWWCKTPAGDVFPQQIHVTYTWLKSATIPRMAWIGLSRDGKDILAKIPEAPCTDAGMATMKDPDETSLCYEIRALITKNAPPK